MFLFFRSRKQVFRIVLAIVIAPVIITMVVTLIPGVGGSSSGSGLDLVLAEVGGAEITARDASARLDEDIQQRRLPAVAIPLIAPQVVQNLVTDEVLLLEAERLGLHVTEQELAEHLRSQLAPILYPEGRFVGNDLYAAFVRDRFKKSIPDFETLIRRDLALTKLRRFITDGVTVSQQQVEAEFRRRNEKARIQYVSVSPASLAASITPAQAEIEEHFKKNRAAYTLPERRSFKYMVIDHAATAAAVSIPAADLQRYYGENRDRFRVQDRVRATHILLKTTDKKDDEIKKIEAKAQDLLQQVRAGKDFAALAKEHSEDTASAAKGGEVGWITRGQTVPEFEQKAFSMKAGEISDLVKTQYGFHVLKVLEREEARLKTLAEVEPAIRQELARDRGEAERARLGERARAAALKHGANLEAAAKEVALPVFTAAGIERGKPLPEIGSEPALSDSLFAATKGVVVGPIQTAAKTVIAVVAETAPSRQAELGEVADRVRADVATAKSRQLAEERARQLADKAKAAGGDLAKVAKELKLEAKTSETFTRDGSIPGLGSASALREAFTAPAGQVLGPATSGADHIVYKVTERIPADAAASVDEQKFIRESMVSNRQNEIFEIFKEELRERLKREGKVKIHQDRLERFVSSRR